MKISIEDLIVIITREVVSELKKLGVEFEFPSDADPDKSGILKKTETSKIKIDLSDYKTPVLTENHLIKLEPAIKEILVPAGTVITPGANDIIKYKKLKIIRES